MGDSRDGWRSVVLLGIAGALGFWLTNFAISLTPVAADYRAALNIAYVPMLIEALVGGMVIGLLVSYGLLRYFDSIPGATPLMKALVLASAALIVATVVIEVPSKLLTSTPDAVRYFAIGGLFNVLRIAALGLVIGWLYELKEEQPCPPE